MIKKRWHQISYCYLTQYHYQSSNDLKFSQVLENLKNLNLKNQREQVYLKTEWKCVEICKRSCQTPKLPSLNHAVRWLPSVQ